MAVLVENGEPVEFGQPLFKVDTRGSDRCSSEFWLPIGARSPCGSSAPAASWASRRWPSSARPTAGPPTWSWPTRPICIGPPKAADSYLKIDRVISAAEIGNVQAIHPGYGFLAENAHFAEVCRSCNIEFIGPSHEAMALVGDKNAARGMAREAGVPTVPGSDGLIDDEAEAVPMARQIGFPGADQGLGGRRRPGDAGGR